MSLRGQGGYAMAALLVALAVMAVLMSVALPVWRHESQREKEEELVWRGQQYIRAIRLFQRRTQGLPPSIDSLVQGHYLRKKYKDPITNDDFETIGAAGVPGQTGQGQRGQGQPAFGTGRGAATPAPSQQSAAFGSSSTAPGGMIGVRSKSKDESIRLYQGRNHYNEWTFIFVSQQPGGPGGGRGQPGGPGGRGQPGQRGGPPGPGGRGAGPEGGRGRGGPFSLSPGGRRGGGGF